MDDLCLVRPSLGLEDEFLALVADVQASGDGWFDGAPGLREGNFPAYVRWLQEGERGAVPEGMVPWTALWLTRRGERSILGMASLRHRLTPYLLEQAGHIGYIVRPSQRRRGYGKRLLALTLQEARLIGIERALLVCESENLGSARVIEANGGVLEDQVEKQGRTLSRYWIELPPNS